VPKHDRILVVRPDRIGDVVLATPLIRALRRTFPNSYLAALVQPGTRDVLANNPNLDAILTDDPDGADAGAVGFWRQVSTLRKHRFDTAMLLLPTERLAWMLFFAGIRTRFSVGKKPYSVLTFMKSVSRNKYIPLRHEADYCLDMGRAIGVDTDDLSVEMFLTDDDRESAWKRLVAAASEPLDGETLIGIHQGSGRSAPNWRVERYVELAAELLEDETTHIILTGGENERSQANRFESLDRRRVTNLIGELSLRETASVISHLAVLVSASTGPMHMAAALRVPTVSLFCPISACSPQLWGPQGNRSEIVMPPEDYCGNRCPGDPHICEFEGGISPPDVARAVRLLLQQRIT
jgi:heptosyltransferase-2